MKASYFHKEWGVGVKMYPYSLDFTDSRGDILTVVKKLKKEVFEGKNTFVWMFFVLVQHNACVPTLLRMHTTMENRRFKKGQTGCQKLGCGRNLNRSRG